MPTWLVYEDRESFTNSIFQSDIFCAPQSFYGLAVNTHYSSAEVFFTDWLLRASYSFADFFTDWLSRHK